MWVLHTEILITISNYIYISLLLYRYLGELYQYKHNFLQGLSTHSEDMVLFALLYLCCILVSTFICNGKVRKFIISWNTRIHYNFHLPNGILLFTKIIRFTLYKQGMFCTYSVGMAAGHEQCCEVRHSESDSF